MKPFSDEATICTLGFCGPSILMASFTHVRNTLAQDYKHLFLYQHFPLANESDVRRVVDYFGCTWIDGGKDLGGPRGANLLYTLVETPYIIGSDHDNKPINFGYDKAMLDVMNADSSLAWLALTPIPLRDGWLTLKNGHIEEIAGHRVYFHNTVDMWSCSIARTEYLRTHHGCVGEYAYYGQIEIPMYNILQEAGMRYGYLIDFLEDSFVELQNPLYQQWKRDHLNGYEKSFADWLTDTNV